MTAVISVPWRVARLTGHLLSGGKPLPTREAPEVDRTYFAVPVRVRFDEHDFVGDDIEVQYLWSHQDAIDWGEADIERRMGVDE